MTKISFLNTSINNLSMEEAIKAIDYKIKENKNAYVVTPNIDHIVQLETDNELRKIYDEADLILTDGMPLIWISNILKVNIKEKVSGSDIFPKVCELAAAKGYKVFLLGAKKGIADIAAKNLIGKYPGLQICGAYSPKFGFEKDKDEIKKIIKIITKEQPDILAVGLGAPKQEKFIYRYRNELKVPISLAIGASIDFEAGHVKRAPLWMQRRGLEWFYRLINDPRRLYKRYLIDGIKIVPIIFKYK